MDLAAEQKWRLFIAVLLPGEIKQSVAAAQEDLRSRAGQSAAGWTRVEQFHLTLKFLGNVKVPDVANLSECLDQAFTPFSPVTVTCLGTGFFPNARRPRIVWAGLSGVEYDLGALHAAAEGASSPFTAEKPENRFHAHVTIARVKDASAAARDEMAHWCDNYQDHLFGTWNASDVVLMKSQLSPKGASYSVVTSFPLSGRTG